MNHILPRTSSFLLALALSACTGTFGLPDPGRGDDGTGSEDGGYGSADGGYGPAEDGYETDGGMATDAATDPEERMVPGVTCATDPVDGVSGDAPDADAYATFHAIGLYWSPAAGATDNACEVLVRRRGECDWALAEELWFDENVHEGLPERTDEYRGSLVDLLPGTTYEVRLTLESGTSTTFPVTTMSEDFPVARTVVIEASRGETLVIDEGGTPDGYILYVAAEGGSTIDVDKAYDVAVQIDASYVIVRGLTLQRARRHGIQIGPVQHVVIEDCDITDWGSRVSSGKYTGFGTNFDSAIHSGSQDTAYVVIQRNELHHPTYDTNSWDEWGNFDHPEGPQGISLQRSGGHHIIRYNHIYSDDDHKFNDGMGDWRNFSYGGFPNRDSDIYGNVIANVWDDAIEAEGSGMNVRVWGNYAHHTFISFGIAGQSLGPFYLYRNVSGLSERGTVESGRNTRGGSFAKIGGESRSSEYTRGRILIYQNTATQPPSRWVSGRSGTLGLRYSSNRKVQDNIRSRNNLLETRSDSEPAIVDHNGTPSNDFDYDLTNSRWNVASGQESNAIIATPRYASDNGELEFFLEAGSPGQDAASVLPGFNSAHAGAGPDMGAFEVGAPPLRFGLDADWTEWALWRAR